MVLRITCALGSEVSEPGPAENNPLILSVHLQPTVGLCRLILFDKYSDSEIRLSVLVTNEKLLLK
jgi:hypothetical protein